SFGRREFSHQAHIYQVAVLRLADLIDAIPETFLHFTNSRPRKDPWRSACVPPEHRTRLWQPGRIWSRKRFFPTMRIQGTDRKLPRLLRHVLVIMGKPTGFLEFPRELPLARDPAARVHDWLEFHEHADESMLQNQGARCMDCGVPFCH